MHPDRWETVNQIFDEALDRPPAERAAFIREASGGDDDICSQVDALLRADAQAASFLDHPAAVHLADLNSTSRPADLPHGTILAERFEIIRFLAEGGMGRVYEAFDRELRIPVALKLIGPEVSSRAEALERFRREITIARRVAHPNVCRTFDFGRAQFEGSNIVFLTMELLRGITLREHLQAHGALSVETALTIAQQVANALEAAHALGVIHRDIKPSNIMLTDVDGDSLKAIVMDFGLARLEVIDGAAAGNEPTLLAVTQAGLPLGTLAYMAPEQIEGLLATPATDVYAFTLVLVEMLSGRRVFHNDNPLSGLAQRLRGSVPLSKLLPATIAPAWLPVLATSLSPDPTCRPPRPRALLDALRAAVPETPSELTPVSRREPSSWLKTLTTSSGPRTQRLRLAGIIVGLALLVSLSWLLVRLTYRDISAAVAQGAVIYVAPLDNHSGIRSLDSLGTLLSSTLQQSQQVRLLESRRVEEVLQSMNRSADNPLDAMTAREIAMRAGAVRIIFPSLSTSGNTVTLSVRMEQPDQTPARPRIAWSKTFQWPLKANGSSVDPQALAAVRTAGEWVRSKAGESADDIARLDVPPEDATTSNWQALEEYTLAEKALSAGKRKEGIIGLQRATQIDPEFALASARLGDQLMASGSWAEALAAYRQAISTAGRQRLTRHELDRVRGIYAIDTRDDATAVAQFRDLSSYYPDDWLAWFYRAAPLLRLGKYAEAQACLERALARKPGQRSVLITLASLALINNDLARAQHWIDALKASGQESDAAWVGAEAAFDAAHVQDVLLQVHIMRQGTDQDRTFVSYLLESTLQSEVGRPDRAITALNEGLHAAETLGDDAEKVLFLMERGSVECRLSQWDVCIEDARAALALERSPNAALLTSQFLARYGFLAPQRVQRQIDSILQAAEQAVDGDQPGPLFEMARLRTRASRELLHHDCGPALRDLQQAAHIDAPAVSHEYLGDAYALCSTVEQNREKASSLRQQAADTYAWGAFHPAFLWYEPNRHPLGSATDQLQAWLALNHAPDSRQDAARQRLRTLRGDHPAEGLSSFPSGPFSPERRPQPSTH